MIGCLWHKIYTFFLCRVESEHNRLKKALGSSSSTFDTFFKKADEIMGIQIIKIKESMEQSKHKIPIDLKRSKLFANLLGHVSRVALDILKKERHRMRGVVTVDARTCGCFYKRTHGGKHSTFFDS